MRKPCCDKQDINKGAWSKEEDQKLIDYINKHGEGCWRTLPKAAGKYMQYSIHKNICYMFNCWIYIYTHDNLSIFINFQKKLIIKI